MIVFISQPMQEKNQEEIKKTYEKCFERCKERYGEDAVMVNSYIEDAPENASPLWYLGESIKRLSEADAAYFAKGWESARGCRIENQCAIEYGLEVVEDYTKDE